ncbi:hypothetical protein TSAR_007699 [Trichomalopsis sarcophagae]|uniref:Uncharacterized protein n=1 Tax=Trichomalopsis sarcophagae TaxID=543379 RepID=A0A232EUX8_9HYME|nr:hypothetical protein TSAR_007699 [Trichomalopsis sarcophagae]
MKQCPTRGANGRTSFSVQRITGELEESGARFGSALSCLGDLDYDGYADLAVSAPYEDEHRGAIYIFQGRAEGIAERYSQRIRAAELSPRLQGFGQAIARDLQGNLAVGAYLSGHAVLLASRPVLVMSLEVRVSENKYSLLTNQTNLPLEFCSSYDGLNNNAPNVIDATFTVQVDKFHHRAIIYEKVAFGDTYRLVATLTKGQEKCTSIKAYFKKNHQNFIDPIMVNAQVNLTDSSCPNCPVISPQLSKTVDELKLAFLLDCGEDAVCVSDLRVVNVTSPDLPTGRFVIGSKPSVNLSLAIENNGEPAYRAQAHVYVPQPIGLARIPPECNEQAQIINKTLELICNAGNPLRDNASILAYSLIYTLLLELDMSAIVYEDETQEIQVVLTSQSKEKHFFDNIQTFLISYDVEADVAIVGKSYEDSYALFERDLTERNYSKHSFDHVYEIQKFGATPIEEAHFTLNVPTHWNDSEIARIRHVQGYMEGRKLDCKNVGKEESDSVLMLPLNRTLFGEGNNSVTVTSEARAFYVNCTNQDVACQTFLCILGPFVRKNSVAKVTVSMDLEPSNNTSIIEEMKGKDVLLFVSEAFVKITQPNITLESDNKKPDFKQISTMFFRLRQAKEAAIVPLWIIVLSVLLGIVLTTILTALLVKFGFFNRRIKDDLDALKSTDEVNRQSEGIEKF